MKIKLNQFIKMNLRLFILFSFLSAFNILNAQSVSITSSASGAICPGTNITFTATVSGISTPTYKWYKNSTLITGATSSTYSTTSLNNSDIIYATAAPSVVTASLVTSNLMTNLDAGNSSSYGGTGTTWTDLTGLGNKATLTGTGYSSVNGGGITFTTSKYATQTLTNPPFNGDFTWSTILKAPDYNTNSWDFLYNVGGYTGLNIALVTGQPRVSWGTWFSDNINVSGLAQMVIGNYYMLTFVRSGNTVSFYLQASPYGTSGTVSATIPVAAPLIAKGPGSEWWENGIMNVMLLYNRALSQTEITQNYNSYATRFGLAAAGVTSNSISTTVDPATPIITVNGDACFNKSILTTTSGLTSYVWYKDNVAVSGAISNSFTPTASGVYKVEVSNGICSNTSTITTLYDCGINSSGKAITISNVSTLISSEGGANLGTAKDLTGKMFNTTSLTTLSAATIGTTSAVLGGVISATNGRTSSFGVIYSTSPSFTTYSTTTIQSNILAGTYSSTITGLASSTTYYAKSFIINNAGTNYGPVVNFTTAAPPPPASFSFSNSNISGNMPNYYIATNNLTLSQLPTSWTIQWTHRTDESTGSGGADGMLWFFRNPSTTGKYSTDMHLYQINGNLQFWYNNNYLNTDQIMSGLTQGTIYKLALTYDGTNLRTYSNGSLISTKAINITVKPSNSTLVMGSNVARTLDEFRIWNSALSQAEIVANQGISVAGSAGLMLYYNFNDGTAGANNTGITSIADQSGNNRNGVFTNTALTGTVNNFVTPIVTGF
jgi:hypothetical protein